MNHLKKFNEASKYQEEVEKAREMYKKYILENIDNVSVGSLKIAYTAFLNNMKKK
jgi:hypothetical protein